MFVLTTSGDALVFDDFLAEPWLERAVVQTRWTATHTVTEEEMQPTLTWYRRRF